MSASLSDLRARWTDLYTLTLPHLATTKNPAQRVWPVHLDHCFARIIYDHVLGESQAPWTSVVKSPAVQHMKPEQLEGCIKIADGIVAGAVDLDEMDRRSLAVRGKGKNGKVTRVKRERGSEGEGQGAKRRVVEEATRRKKQSDIRVVMARSTVQPRQGDEEDAREVQIQSKYFAKATTAPLPILTPPRSSSPSSPSTSPISKTSHHPVIETSLPSSVEASLPTLILTSPLPAHTHRVLLALLQIPPGQYTTYGSLARFLASSPRAVGNAVRKNPFAPSVPCHRVLAADGSIGGYMGEWGSGERVERKVALLRGEGVRFDGRGRAVGGVWGGWR